MAITSSSKDDKVNIAWLPWEPDKCPDLFPLVTEQGGKSLFLPFSEAFPQLLLHELCGMCLVGLGEMSISVLGLCNQNFGYKLAVSMLRRGICLFGFGTTSMQLFQCWPTCGYLGVWVKKWDCLHLSEQMKLDDSKADIGLEPPVSDSQNHPLTISHFSENLPE